MLTALVLAGSIATGASDGEASFDAVLNAFDPPPGAAAFGMANGIAAADFDADGDVDLFVPTRGGLGSHVYRNDGHGHFTDVAAALGITSAGNARGGLWLDVDGDGDLDLLVVRDAWSDASDGAPEGQRRAGGGDDGDADGGDASGGAGMLRLYRQDAPDVFTDVTATAGLDTGPPPDDLHVGGLAAGDVDGDGLPELMVTVWNGPSWFFRNLGGVTFADATQASGLSATALTAWQPVFHDFDRDGRLDLFIAIDFGPNHLWMNQGDGTFRDVAPEASVDNAWNEMGVALGDLDHDGDLDLYTTNIFRVVVGIEQTSLLYRNDTTEGPPRFTDVTNSMGVGDAQWGWGCTFVDADRDTHLDLVATNGFSNPPWTTDRSRYFHRDGDAFTERGAEVGIADTDWGSAMIAVDVDRDGDLDLLQTCQEGPPVRVFRNGAAATPADRHWISVRPRRADGNTHGIGAVVRVRTGSLVQTRVITAGTSMLGQEPAEAWFGLAESSVVDSVHVAWPDGTVTVRTDVAADQVLEVWVAGSCDADLDGDGTVGFVDLLDLLGAWGPCDGCPADLDDDGAVDARDLRSLRAQWGACPS